jgi:replicative DNA helicase
MESEIIAACRSHSWYSQYRKLLRPEMVSSHAYVVLTVLDKYYSSTKKDISTQDLYTLVKLQTQNQGVLDLVQDITPSTVILEALQERYYFSKIAEMSLDIVEAGNVDPKDIQKLLAEFFSKTGVVLEHDQTSVNDLFSSQSVQGFDWPVKFLDDAVGPLEPGSMVLFAARPEAGKTTMLAHVTTHMAQQTTSPVLVILNEEPVKAAKSRYIQALLGKTRAEIQQDIMLSLSEIKSKLGCEFDERFKFYHNPSLTIEDISSLAERWSPSIIVVDQLRNVQARGRYGTDVERLKYLYEHSRRMAAAANAVFFTVHQARGDAEGVPYISGNQLEGCQTEVQGALDVQIMIGKDNDPMNEHIRYLNIVKNKSRGVRDESKRHGREPVHLDRMKARFT